MLNYLWSPTVCSCFAENKAQWLTVSCWEPFSGCWPEGSYTTSVLWQSGSAFISAFRFNLHKINQPSSCKMFLFSLSIHQDVPELSVLYQEKWKFEFWGRIHDTAYYRLFYHLCQTYTPSVTAKLLLPWQCLHTQLAWCLLLLNLPHLVAPNFSLHILPIADHVVRAIQQQVSLGLLYHCSMTDFRARMAKFRKVVFLSNP